MQRTALITGASGGIGYELAKLFGRDKYNLVLVARSGVVLEQFAAELATEHGIKTLPIKIDLADANAPDFIFERIKQEQWHIDVVVNNAGFGANGFFHELDLKTQLEILQVNVVALTHLTKLFLPAMIQRKFGGILNVASTAAFVPGPLMAVYYASKAYVLSFSEALTNEVAGNNIVVSCLCPGATITGFQERANMVSSRLFNSSTVMDAATVARIGYNGFKDRKPVVVTGLSNRLAVFLSRFFPRSLTASVARRVQETTKTR